MILSFLLGIIFTVAHAQSTDASILNTYSDLIQEKVNVTIDPQNPAPRTPATITLDSYGNNLDAALIKWTINGKVVQTGTGDKVLKVITGNAGQVSVVDVVNDGTQSNAVKLLVRDREGRVVSGTVDDDLIYGSPRAGGDFAVWKGLPTEPATFGSVVSTAVPWDTRLITSRNVS